MIASHANAQGLIELELEKEYNAKQVEEKWQEYWEKEKIFAFNFNEQKKPVFVIDTPPPTVSGTIHIGHAFSYSQAEFIARYKRMNNYNVYYPFGFDDNGLPTEKFVEKTRNIKAIGMKREEFAKLCLETTKETEKEYKKTWTKLGISCDWSQTYSTISKEVQLVSQLSFLELLEMGREYQAEAVTLHCPECRTAIAQVELEDKELESTFNDIEFELEDKQKIIIATTRPELLAGCVAIFVNPKDKTKKQLVGKNAIVPIFNHKVPILKDKRASMEKGTGIVMCCTFGDQTDIEWWKAHKLPLRICFNADGTLNEYCGKFKGMKIKEAREAIIGELKSTGKLLKQEKIKHSVNAHERCGTEIEFLVTKQWFIKYLDLKKEFLELGKKIKWRPKQMKTRYDNWVKGLQWDWCISRQRYNGIPFPVWYCKKCNNIILPKRKQLPIDPLVDKPLEKCSKCNSSEFLPETDVLDTWATSSLTPLIISGWKTNPEKFSKLFPTTLRPQAHDIISFWAFNTIVKSYLHCNTIPWNTIMISGHGLDSKGKPMHKSKGNVISPLEIIEKYSADALRFWAAGVKLGEDAPFQEKDVLTGKKFCTKLWNSGKFILQNTADYTAVREKRKEELEAIDIWLLTKLNNLIEETTKSFEEYNYSKAKKEIEEFFFHTYCDYYLEIVKDRLYNANRGKKAKESSQFTLKKSFQAIIKMISPIMPFITEELYQLFLEKEKLTKESVFATQKQEQKEKSIHLSKWPKKTKEFSDAKIEKKGDSAIKIIAMARAFKTQNKKSLKQEINLELEKKYEKNIQPFLADIKAVTNAKQITFGKQNKFTIIETAQTTQIPTTQKQPITNNAKNKAITETTQPTTQSIANNAKSTATETTQTAQTTQNNTASTTEQNKNSENPAKPNEQKKENNQAKAAEQNKNNQPENPEKAKEQNKQE